MWMWVRDWLNEGHNIATEAEIQEVVPIFVHSWPLFLSVVELIFTKMVFLK